MDIVEQINKVRKVKGLTQQEVADRLSMNQVQYSRLGTRKSDPTMNVLHRIADGLEINMVEFFEAKNNGKEVNTVNEPLLQKVRLREELDEVQKNSICNMIDTAIVNKRLKEALNNAMNIAICKD
ncbi:MAG: XRE family transcriptional regulator [Saprospirales bacterium]|nr:MAG: XRE family transcriptional regulator [Saprospirales bacterium]